MITKPFKFSFMLVTSLLATISAHAAPQFSEADFDKDGVADLTINTAELSAVVGARGGAILSLHDKLRDREIGKILPGPNKEGIGQVKFPGLLSTIATAPYTLTGKATPDGGAVLEAVAEIPMALSEGDVPVPVGVTKCYIFEPGSTRIRMEIRLENRGKKTLNFVPWLKHLLLRDSGPNPADLARVSFATPYGVWDSLKPIPGRKGALYTGTNVHYLTASNWISRTLQPTDATSNTVTTVTMPGEMFKVYTWRKTSEEFMTEEAILAPREVAPGKSHLVAYYFVITPALETVSYASPSLNLEVSPQPLGLPSTTTELTLRLAAPHALSEVSASGQLERLDKTEPAQAVSAQWGSLTNRAVATATIPVRLVANGRYQLKLKLSQQGKAFLPGADIGDNAEIVIPLVTDNETPTEISYPNRVAGTNLFAKLQPQRVTAPQVFGSKALSVFQVPSTKRVFEQDVYQAADKKNAPILLKAAANEYESLQLVLSSRTAQNLAVAATHLSGPGQEKVEVDVVSKFLYAGTEVPSRYSPKYPIGRYPDALLPTKSLEVAPNVPTPLMVTYRVPRGTPPGLYQGQITLGEGKASQHIPVTMQVWDYELPMRPAIDMTVATKAGGTRVIPMYFKYKLTPSILPVMYDLLAGKWEAVKKQMPAYIEQGMTRTYLGSTEQLLANPGPERLKEIEAFLKENGWLEYFYVRPALDEASPDKLPLMKERLARWKSVSSVATMENYYYDTGIDQLYGLMNIYSRGDTGGDWTRERKKAGDSFWRVNAMPSALESNLPDLWGLYLRMAENGFSGTYIWTVSAWLEMEWGKDWWADAGVGNLEATLIWKDDRVEGGLIPTIRLEAMRNVIEGFTLFTMLRDRVNAPRPGDDKAQLEKARALLTGVPLSKQVKTDADVERVRQEMGDALSALNSSNKALPFKGL